MSHHTIMSSEAAGQAVEAKPKFNHHPIDIIILSCHSNFAILSPFYSWLAHGVSLLLPPTFLPTYLLTFSLPNYDYSYYYYYYYWYYHYYYYYYYYYYSLAVCFLLLSAASARASSHLPTYLPTLSIYLAYKICQEGTSRPGQVARNDP